MLLMLLYRCCLDVCCVLLLRSSSSCYFEVSSFSLCRERPRDPTNSFHPPFYHQRREKRSTNYYVLDPQPQKTFIRFLPYPSFNETTMTTTVFPDFPYTVEDEPTEDWTVEQTLQWWLLRAHDETDATFEDIVKSLTEQMDRGKEEIWECHNHVKQTLNNPMMLERSGENVDPQQKQHYQNKDQNMDQNGTTTTTKSQQQQASATASQNISNSTVDTIHVEILSGEYEGNSYDLKPKAKAPCWIGRSTGKKFRDRGISLTKDLEVSTTHGKFELVRGSQLCFTDVNSTNGSKVNGIDLDPDTPFELQNGTEILVGQTKMKITLK